jgi:AcrR family transcriptional regulator
LVSAALEAYGIAGLDVALDAIAQRAGVGNATLYRHFPTRGDLEEAVFSFARDQLADVLPRYDDVADGWTGLCAFAVDLFLINPAGGIARMVDQRVDLEPRFVEMLGQVGVTARRLLELGQAQGTVRSDVDEVDVGFLMASVRSVVVASNEVAPDLWRRHLMLVLDALRPESPTSLPPHGASDEQRDRIFRTVTNG